MAWRPVDIPDGAVWLASTPAGAHQAFSIGPNVLGLQFHLEADVRQIERWLVGHACELAQASIDLHALRADAARHGDRLACAARRVLADWLRHLDHQGASAGG